MKCLSKETELLENQTLRRKPRFLTPSPSHLLVACALSLDLSVTGNSASSNRSFQRHNAKGSSLARAEIDSWYVHLLIWAHPSAASHSQLYLVLQGLVLVCLGFNVSNCFSVKWLPEEFPSANHCLPNPKWLVSLPRWDSHSDMLLVI